MKEILYEAIFKRKSVRKYDMLPLSQDTLATIMEFAIHAEPLCDGIAFEFAFLGTKEVNGLMAIKAPHYLCIYSEKKEGYLMNAGYVLQQADLFLSSINIGSCWLGVAKPNKDIPLKRNGLDFVIMLAFGNATEPVHRENIAAFRRKSLSEITNIQGMDHILEPVRLAPSASNTQAWFFGGNQKEIIVSRAKLNLIKNAVYGKMNQTDIGIALCHLCLSLAQQGKTMSLSFVGIGAPDGFEFMTKVDVADKES